jgi:tungstate transport system ATP-binding protein
MARAIYEVHNLRQMYNQRTVLQIDSLDIYSGEILALVGPSGAGKSTLLRHLNFLEEPAEGHLIFENSRFNGVVPPLELRRRVTTVFQQPVLLNRSVAANVAYGLKLRGKNGVRAKQAVNKALKQVGLLEFADVSAKTLSGGEAQRVALARALVIEPDVLLLDEPTANLDPYNIRMIEEIVAEVNHTQSTTVVLVTHNIFQAKRLADRTALILDGKIVEVADTHSFL